MKRVFSALALACALAMPIVAHADIITTFGVSGHYTFTQFPGSAIGTASGTVTIDTTTGVAGLIDLSFTGKPTNISSLGPDSGVISGGPTPLAYFGDAWAGQNYSYAGMQIVLPVATLVGYTGGAVCSTGHPCYANSSFLHGPVGQTFIDGQLTAVSPVPEPSSFVLLGTGLLGLVGAVRRRL